MTRGMGSAATCRNPTRHVTRRTRGWVCDDDVRREGARQGANGIEFMSQDNAKMSLVRDERKFENKHLLII
jgi:hypothetical protein